MTTTTKTTKVQCSNCGKLFKTSRPIQIQDAGLSLCCSSEYILPQLTQRQMRRIIEPTQPEHWLLEAFRIQPISAKIPLIFIAIMLVILVTGR